jgi:hypothetical protein
MTAHTVPTANELPRHPPSPNLPSRSESSLRSAPKPTTSRTYRDEYGSEREEQNRRGWESAGGDRERAFSPTRKSRPWSYASTQRGYITDGPERDTLFDRTDRAQSPERRYFSTVEPPTRSSSGVLRRKSSKEFGSKSGAGYRKTADYRGIAAVDDANRDSVSDRSELYPGRSATQARPPLAPRLRTSTPKSTGYTATSRSYMRSQEMDDDEDEFDEKSPTGTELPSTLKALSNRPGASLYTSNSRKTTSSIPTGQLRDTKAATSTTDGGFPRTVSIEGLRAYFTDEDLKNFSESTRNILFGDKNGSTSSHVGGSYSQSYANIGPSSSRSTVASSIRGALSESESRPSVTSTTRPSLSRDRQPSVVGAEPPRKGSIREMIRARVKERDMEQL